jgi:hypothetical protein
VFSLSTQVRRLHGYTPRRNSRERRREERTKVPQVDSTPDPSIPAPLPDRGEVYAEISRHADARDMSGNADVERKPQAGRRESAGIKSTR